MADTNTSRKPKPLNLGSVQPSGVSHKPKPEDVKDVAESQAFTSREGQGSSDDVAPVPTVKRRPGARKKGRTESLNTRLKPKTLNRIIEICTQEEWGYAEFIEHAVETFERDA